jgi:hypothetical protein
MRRLKTITIFRSEIVTSFPRMLPIASIEPVPSKRPREPVRPRPEGPSSQRDAGEFLDRPGEVGQHVVRAGPGRDGGARGGGHVHRDPPSRTGLAHRQVAPSHALRASFEVHVGAVGFGPGRGRDGHARFSPQHRK